jgi:hypothetical protein
VGHTKRNRGRWCKHERAKPTLGQLAFLARRERDACELTAINKAFGSAGARIRAMYARDPSIKLRIEPPTRRQSFYAYDLTRETAGGEPQSAATRETAKQKEP